MDYYYIDSENKAAGPVSQEKLQALFDAGTLTPHTKIAAVGSQSWQPIFTVLSEPPPTPPSGSEEMLPPPLVAQAAPVVIGQTKTDSLAIVSLVLSILALPFNFICCLGLPLAIGGVVCGHLSRSRIKKKGGLPGNGLALAGVITGYVSLVVFLIWVVVVFSMNGTIFEELQREIQKIEQQQRQSVVPE